LLHGPVMTTLKVYADFVTYSGGVYKRTSSDALGGHAISIIGYDDATQSWIIRNSWGENWGEKGFAHISYDDDSGVSDSTWGFNIPAVDGYVSTVSPRDYSYLNGIATLNGSSNLQKTDSLRFNVLDSSGKNVLQAGCASATCSVKIDTSTLKDDRYEIQTVAMDTSGQELGKSNRQFFYTVNSTTEIKLNFAGADGLDMSKPLTDRVVFQVTSTSKPVPMSVLEFHIKNLATGHEEIRSSETVLDSMTLGWRTNMTANGEYELWMVGRIQAGTMESSAETAHVQVKVQN
jgi:hypothetical protein